MTSNGRQDKDYNTVLVGHFRNAPSVATWCLMSSVSLS